MKLKIFVIFLIVSGLFGCGDGEPRQARKVKPEHIPEGLKDCTFDKLYSDEGNLIITRCPNSSTTTKNPVYKKPARIATVMD